MIRIEKLFSESLNLLNIVWLKENQLFSYKFNYNNQKYYNLIYIHFYKN